MYPRFEGPEPASEFPRLCPYCGCRSTMRLPIVTCTAVECRGPHFDQPLFGVGLRRTDFQHFDFEMQFIFRSYRPRPSELVEAGSHDTTRWLELALHQEPHRKCRRVPAARRKSLKDRVARGLFVEVERLRIEFLSKFLDSLCLDPRTAGAKGLAHGEVFKNARSFAISSGTWRGGIMDSQPKPLQVTFVSRSHLVGSDMA